MNLADKIEYANKKGGANHWYGMRLRPPGLSCQPGEPTATISIDEAKELFPNEQDYTKFRHGAIAYTTELEKRDIEHYSLSPLSNKPLEIVNNDDLASWSIDWLFDMMDEDKGKPDSVSRVIDDLKDDGEYMIRMSFKDRPEFTERKSQPPETFEKFKETCKTVTPEFLINRLQSLTKAV